MSSIYEKAKSLAKSFLPEQLLFKYELPLRSVFALPYKGNQFQCNVCGSRLNRFIQLDRGDALCPVCGSLPRHRRLWHLLQDGHLKGTLLHFSPSRALWRVLNPIAELDYHTSDYEASPLVQYQYDITKMPVEDESYDTIICYHVLEHIIDDAAAISELFRTLKKGGKVFVQTPFKTGEIYEDFSITKPADRLIHFGQEDHVRIYSVAGLVQRLEKAGFEVEKLEFDETESKMGFKDKEVILIAKKT